MLLSRPFDPAIARVKRACQRRGIPFILVTPGIHPGANLDQFHHKQRAGEQHATLKTRTAWELGCFPTGRLVRSGGEDQPPRRRCSASLLPGVRVWVTPPTAMACTRAHLGTYAFALAWGWVRPLSPWGSPINLRGMADRGHFPPMFLRHLRSLPFLRSAGFRSYVPQRHQCTRRPPHTSEVRQWAPPAHSTRSSPSPFLSSLSKTLLDRHHSQSPDRHAAYGLPVTHAL